MIDPQTPCSVVPAPDPRDASQSAPTVESSTFRLEAEMQPLVRRWLESQGLDVRSELRSPWGFCDLVGVEWDPAHVAHRLSLRQRKPISSLAAHWLLSRIPDETTGRSRTVSSLQSEAADALPGIDARSEINKLLRDRFLASPRSGLVQKVNGWAPVHRRIVAVELKLTRVAEAIAQAESNLGYATASFIALPVDVAMPLVRTRRVAALERGRIGLLAVSDDRCEVVHQSGERAPTESNLLEMSAVERFWARRVRGS